MKYTKTRGSGIQCEDNALVFNIATLSLTCADKNEFEFGNLWVSEVSRDRKTVISLRTQQRSITAREKMRKDRDLYRALTHSFI